MVFFKGSYFFKRRLAIYLGVGFLIRMRRMMRRLLTPIYWREDHENIFHFLWFSCHQSSNSTYSTVLYVDTWSQFRIFTMLPKTAVRHWPHSMSRTEKTTLSTATTLPLNNKQWWWSYQQTSFCGRASSYSRIRPWSSTSSMSSDQPAALQGTLQIKSHCVRTYLGRSTSERDSWGSQQDGPWFLSHDSPSSDTLPHQTRASRHL
jgi:hypothetical protein